MDLCVVLSSPQEAADVDDNSSPTHEGLKEAISRAWRVQKQRFRGMTMVSQNGDIASADGIEGFQLGSKEKQWLDSLGKNEIVSYRALSKVVKVGRTIADLEERESIELDHLREAWSLRCQSLSTSPFGF
jgi:magnesium chelatase family protein